MTTKDFFKGVKQMGHEVDHVSPLKLRMPTALMAWYMGKGDNFNLTLSLQLSTLFMDFYR
jgi:hypothetical protein